MRAPGDLSCTPDARSRLIVISNRLPFTASIKEGQPCFTASAGGLASGLWNYLERLSTEHQQEADFLWLGWPGSTIDSVHQAAVQEHGQKAYRASSVFLPEESMDRFYLGFCNRTIWPLFHYFPSLARYEQTYWNEYKRVNQRFFESLLEILRPDDTVWVHDYQLMLLPALIRERFPNMPIGYFLHIPFPSFELFRLLPNAWRTELIEGMLGASLIGFHTHDYTRHFLGCVLRTSGIDHQLGSLTVRDRIIKVDTFPMGVDFQKFDAAARSKVTADHVEQLRDRCAGQKVIFSVDRLDYTKGLLNRLRGYDLFLRRNPQWHGKVTFILSVAPSRTGVESYRTMRKEIEQTVGRIAGAYGNVHWSPLTYQYRNLSFDEIVAMYRLCDVALITPLRDGMNLVAKEFVASRPDQTGVLILSEMAGAAKEMGEAILVSPFHDDEIADAIEQALNVSAQEQVRRNLLLQDRLRRYDSNRWANDFLHSLASTRTNEEAQRALSLTSTRQATLVREYQSAKRRTLFLDYDGSLVPFATDPKVAQPDPEVLELLRILGSDPATSVVIVSGRPRVDLENWLGQLPIGLIAEHGVWLRPRGGAWQMPTAVTAGWKTHVRPILRLYVDRLPGALLEEKEFSLAWHYRRADAEQASRRARELLDDLADYTRNIDVQVLEGNKVIEVRNTVVTKGTAAIGWLNGDPAGFVLATGDDWTDEDLFRALPPGAFSIRVGLANTAARFHVGSLRSIRRLLRELCDARIAT